MAVLSKEPMLDVLALRIKVIHDYVGVAGVAGCEDNDFKVFRKGPQDIDCMGTYVDAGFDFLASRKLYFYLNVVRQVDGVVAVDEGLVQVKDDRLPV